MDERSPVSGTGSPDQLRTEGREHGREAGRCGRAHLVCDSDCDNEDDDDDDAADCVKVPRS